MVRKKAKAIGLTMYAVDMALTVLSFFAGYWIREQWFIAYDRLLPISTYLWLLVFILPAWSVALVYVGAYRVEKRVSTSSDGARIFVAVVLGMAALTAILFLSRSIYFSRLFMLSFALTNIALLVVGRAVFRSFASTWLKRPMNLTNVLVVGTGEAAQRVAALVKGHKELGLNFVGFVLEEKGVGAGMSSVVGTLDDILGITERHFVDEVVFAVDRERIEKLEDVFLMLEDVGVNTRLVLNIFPHIIARVQVEELDEVPLLTFTTLPADELALFIKRAFDVAASFILMSALSPVFLLAAILVKAASSGPVFFVQQRCGINGRQFAMYKFRSMYSGAHARQSELEHLSASGGPAFKLKDDPRITRIGALLRKMSIDELPQLWNVLKGDMSMVGPRPPVADEVAKYARWQKRRLSMRPGLTCIWQVSGRSNIGFEEWMRLDLQYIDNWSLKLDAKILLKTIPAVLFGRGAY
ncbi:MAG: sugar transferase [Deltaproteobacteria bacterium]|nr:sugar transferase [Deltaproteobacteria bacterium]